MKTVTSSQLTKKFKLLKQFKRMHLQCFVITMGSSDHSTQLLCLNLVKCQSSGLKVLLSMSDAYNGKIKEANSLLNYNNLIKIWQQLNKNPNYERKVKRRGQVPQPLLLYHFNSNNISSEGDIYITNNLRTQLRPLQEGTWDVKLYLLVMVDF